MDVTFLQAAAVIVTSVIAGLLEIVPQLKKHWDKLNPSQKQLAIGIGVFIFAVGTAGYNCRYSGDCPANLEKFFVETFLMTFVMFATTQGTHGLTKRHSVPLAVEVAEEVE